MTDCDDTPDFPVATLDRLISEFEGLGTEPQTGFVAEPYLVVPQYQVTEDRPVARRSELAAPATPQIRSHALGVETASSTQADAIDPNEVCEVACTIRNFGGVAAKSTRIELYVEHLEPNAAIDTTDGTVEIEQKPGQGDTEEGYEVTGVTTMAPDSKLTVFAHTGTPGQPPYDRVLAYDADVEVSQDRTFSAYLDGIPDEFINGDSVPTGTTNFTVEVYDTTLTDPAVIGPTATVPGLFQDPSMWGALQLATAPGRYAPTPGDSDDREDHNLTTIVPASDQMTEPYYPPKPVAESEYVSVPASGEQTVRFEYDPVRSDFHPPRDGIQNIRDGFPGIDPDDGPGIGRAVTAFYARVYSLATAQTPSNWDALDHTTSRLMGRTELPRIIEDA
jgi:hypothetical protein